MASVAKKRKVDSEGRRFQERWKLEYFFTEIRNSCVCLICHETVAVFKEFNIRRHYQTKHSNYDNLTGYERSETLKQLEAVLSAQQSFFTTARESHENATKASYDVATLIASHCIPFTEDGLLSHDKDDVVDRVAYLEKKLQTQEDEIVCLKSAMADVIRRLASVENSSHSNGAPTRSQARQSLNRPRSSMGLAGHTSSSSSSNRNHMNALENVNQMSHRHAPVLNAAASRGSKPGRPSSAHHQSMAKWSSLATAGEMANTSLTPTSATDGPIWIEWFVVGRGEGWAGSISTLINEIRRSSRDSVKSGRSSVTIVIEPDREGCMPTAPVTFYSFEALVNIVKAHPLLYESTADPFLMNIYSVDIFSILVVKDFIFED
ncbi:hypothetical protein RRG08_000588 [Elysia crispata]|uniref:SPIN-DOC-like zinc-finger domain-containing protein n=1 Tax=Elysia crispata TaxID=231223 RepID=A0AAE1CUC9_9GAST|nr:hypothetical protein RRG08_000588 [Elysia crispata]